jgi:hypothetical protein
MLRRSWQRLLSQLSTANLTSQNWTNPQTCCSTRRNVYCKLKAATDAHTIMCISDNIKIESDHTRHKQWFQRNKKATIHFFRSLTATLLRSWLSRLTT